MAFLLYNQSSKYFLEKISKISRSLLTISGKILKKTPNINEKKPKTRHYIFDTSNLF